MGFGSGPATNSYWDTETSGNSTSHAGTGKTTSELQSPTGYTGIYANWNLNFDGQTGNDDPWNFGTANQYPTLKYSSQVSADQPRTVTLSVSPTTIWERALTTPSRVNTATVTATLDKKWNAPVVVTLPTNAAAYTMNPLTITIPAGSTTGTSTLTAVNNYTDAANNTVTLALDTHPADTRWVVKGSTDPSITINDDDELTKPTGVKLSADGTKIRVDWTAVTGATGYKVQWNSTSSTDWSSPTEATTTGNSATTHTISSGLSANTTYYVRVLPTKSGADEPPSDVKSTTTRASAGTGDYDADNDGLIEVKTAAQLNAIRYDLDGDGAVDNATNQTAYDTAFPNAEANMGCNEGAGALSNDTGNPACDGYELAANIDLNVSPHNTGAGWTPIGDATTGYTGEFDGHRASYKISNLFINSSATSGNVYAGLFGVLGTGAEVKDVRLEGVSVTAALTSSTGSHNVYAGALAGKNSGTVTGSSSLALSP